MLATLPTEPRPNRTGSRLDSRRRMGPAPEMKGREQIGETKSLRLDSIIQLSLNLLYLCFE